MTNNIKHAIIGCGRIAQNHFNAATQNEFDVVCCCDLDINKAKEFANKNNIKSYTNNYFDILNNNNIDSISICTDHKSHVEIAKEFIEKKHIIIEKPLSTNYELAKSFYEDSKNSQKNISVIAQHRFDEVVNLVKKMLDDKVFGNITLVNAELICNRSMEYYKDSYWRGTIEKEGGSTIINQSFHMVDTLSYLFGEPSKVYSFLKNFKFKDIIETEDTCVSIMDYDTFLCTLSSTNTAVEEWATKIKIVGDKGSITFNIDFPEEITELNISKELLNKYKKDLEEIQKNYKVNLNSPANYYGLSHIKQFANFKESILNSAKSKVSVKESLDTQKIIEMIYKTNE